MTTPDACPSCGAALRAGQPWCTLCYADLRPPAEVVLPEPAPVVSVVDPLDLSRPLATPAAATAFPETAQGDPGPTWPCTGCGASNALERDTCGNCGAGFLAGARGDTPVLELPVVGDLSKLGRAQRLGLAAGLVVAFLVLVLVLGLLFG